MHGQAHMQGTECDRGLWADLVSGSFLVHGVHW